MREGKEIITNLEEYCRKRYHYDQSYPKSQLQHLRQAKPFYTRAQKHYGMLFHKKFQWIQSKCRKNYTLNVSESTAILSMAC